jgi:lysophospholipase L1-like esterase
MLPACSMNAAARFRRLALPVAVAAVIGVTLAACGGSSSASSSPTSSGSPAVSSPAAVGPRYGYYLSVGDSLAFGFQQAKFDQETTSHSYSPTSFTSGYSDLVLAGLQKAEPSLTLTNLGCPGETTATYLKGGCPTTATGDALHTQYTGSQSAAALAFLKIHSGVGLITVALGANDLNATIASCPTLAVSCIEPKLPAVFAQVQTNLTQIVSQLHAAAPSSRIIVLELYNPYAVDVPASDLIAQALNQQIATAATAGGAVVVNAYPVFNVAASEKTTLCQLTAYCTPLKDIHPTDAGYQALAALFLAAAQSK